ncbi:MAG: flagellar biosynthetic protein FliR [Treponema sp.]|nr:flagellar biosynthetic protein FliR [Treponema sp.]
MPSGLLRNAPLFILIAARCLALIMTLPLFSSQTVSRKVKVALAGFLAYFIFPELSLVKGTFVSYRPFISPEGNFDLTFVLLVLGEALIGVITGFYVQIIFSVFSTAGQLFAFQMGFSASNVYDSLSQVENPLMGQFLNFVALMIFLQPHFFRKLFIDGLRESFHTITAFSVVNHTDRLFGFMTSSLTALFFNAFKISLPIIGTLFLVNVVMGIVAKSAPQMNLLSESFPIMILTAFVVIWLLFPNLTGFFREIFDSGYRKLGTFFNSIRGGL